MSDAQRDLWFSGDLSFLTRPGAQLFLYNTLHSSIEDNPQIVSPYVFKCHRRLGKSFLMLLMLVERCLRYPAQRCVYGAPTYEQVRSIAIPNLSILLKSCPPELLPKTQGHTHIFSNPFWPQGSTPSTLDIVGVNYKHGDLLRGTFLDACALDEVRDMEEPRYLVEDVLLYQFVGRKRPWLTLVSTPPRSADHEFESYFTPQAMVVGRYQEIPITKNSDWDPRDERMLLSSIGGAKDSISWRREALCEPVGDEDELILPEFQSHQSALVKESIQRPTHFFPHTCLDTGWNDWNAALFGYVDFTRQTLVIEDEVVARYQSTGAIAELIRSKELLHYGKNPRKPVRMGDLTEQALADMRLDHKIFIKPADKYDRESAIATLRTGIMAGRVEIHERCRNLIYQCRNGIWNKQRTQFERSERIGHCDALAALIYLYRMARWHHNPFPDPASPELFGETFYSPHKNKRKISSLLKALGRDVQ